MGIEYGGELLLTVAEAAGYLDVSKTSVGRYFNRGLLTRRRVAGDHRTFVTLSSLMALRKSDSNVMRDLEAKVEALSIRVDELSSYVGFVDRRLDDDPVAEKIRKHHPTLK
jgi:hypothetical protein